MANDQPDLIARINEAQQRITEMFLHQCAYGAQTKRLRNEYAACGQFIGGNASGIEQHGLHGISAALRVLGPCPSDECRSIVRRIVTYCEAAFKVDDNLHLVSDMDLKGDDKQNVIKIGELLHALSFVTAAQAERDPLVRYLANLLTTSLIDGKGWGYFLDDKIPELLPTAYAVRGLAQNGYDVSDAREFLTRGLNARNQSGTASPADLTTVVACAYCLTFCPNPTGVQDPLLRATFLSVWSSLEPLMDEDIEQNLEYWHGNKTEYIRIPWQLYLLALAAEYSRWRFAGFRAQRRLTNVIDAVRSGSFKYPYSGTYLSSRTNSVAYDVLTTIRDRIRHLTWLRIANFIDSVRVFSGSRTVRRIAALLAVLVIIYAIREWMQTGKASDLAPELIASFIALVLAWARR